MERASDLRAEGRRRDQPGVRIAARPLPTATASAICWRTSTASPRRRLTGMMSPWAVKRLDEFGGDISKFAVGQADAVEAAPDRHRQDRAGRREQPGHLGAGRQGRYPQARALQPERSRCLLLLGRPVPHEPGPARIRRNVQGADQGAAPAADGDAGRQLHRHRERSAPFPSRASSWRTRTNPSGSSSRPTRTTRRSSTASASSRCRIACASTEETKIYKKLLRESELARGAVRAGDAGDAGRVLRADAPARSTRIRTSTPRCASMTARS